MRFFTTNEHRLRSPETVIKSRPEKVHMIHIYSYAVSGEDSNAFAPKNTHLLKDYLYC